MAKPQEFPRYTVSQFDRAARRYVKLYDADDIDSLRLWAEAFDVMSNWRAAHGFPLGRIRQWLGRKALKVDPKANIVQRLKRLRSIHTKLVRPGRSWRLTQIQDIAGCRAIVKSVPAVQLLAHRLKSARIQHRLVNEFDYLKQPQQTGYRSHHIVYEFSSDKHPSFEGMLCEIQLRTPHQHAWATAVEVAGFFLDQDLKGGEGDEEWLRFFALASGAIAMKEGTAPIPGVPEERPELMEELEHFAKKLDVIEWMSGFRYTPHIGQRSRPDTFWYLLTFNIQTRIVKWDEFTIDETELANSIYDDAERQSLNEPHLQTVLVSADGLRALRTAYPSFFGDSVEFVKMMQMLLGAEAQ